MLPIPVPEGVAGAVVGGDAAGGDGEGAKEFAMEKDGAAEWKVGTFDHDSFVVIAFVFGGESRADRREPTARAAVETDRLARRVGGLSETDMNLVLASETARRHETIRACVTRCVKQSKATWDFAL
jgi:hypothetical protein